MKLEHFANDIRLTTLEMLKHKTFGHLGGSMSIVETLSVLYGKHMRVDPQNPTDPLRDYFVLSKGHAGPALYATLALKGFFDKSLLKTLNDDNTTLPSNCDMNITKGIDMTTGSLGQGFSAAVGIAKGLQIQNKNNHVYVIVGDGELNEGQCYEAMMFAVKHKLHNLTVFIDDNKLQLDGFRTDISDTADFKQRFNAFGFHTQTINGHDVHAIDSAINEAKNTKGKPTVIILDTIKGKGIKAFENRADNHHMRFSDHDNTILEETIKALKEGQS